MSTTPFSNRALNIHESATGTAFVRAGELKRQGVDLISLVAGEPDFDTPQNIKDAAIQAIASGKTKYTMPASGIPELKEAICNKFHRDNGLSYNTDQIIVTCGAKQTIFDAIVVLINPGDEAIIPAPYWVSYTDQVRLMDGHPVIVETDAASGFRMTAEQLQKALTPKTKLVLFNSPCNPTGAVYSESELQDLARVIADAGIYVISDEIYEKLIYDDEIHISIASYPGLQERTLVVNGLSKAYAMTGWRVGYGAGPPDLIRLMAKIQSQETTNTCSISQYAALEALTGPQESVEHMRQTFCKRRDLMVERLQAIPGITCSKPAGAFYVFPDISAYFGKSSGDRQISNDLDLNDFLLDKARVAGVPGSGFGAPNYIRFSYAARIDQIQQALDQIEQALSPLYEGRPNL
ncbi:MAG: pyridoxal phosphate-dependent aminotransferase [bacterium]|nr:pyridoxal phosphate-dependent aminotransferase [bacterium]